MEDYRNTGLCTIMDLPNDWLVSIFKRLSCKSDRESFGLTCRKWLEIQNQNRELLQIDSSSTNFMVQRTLTRFPHLKSLSLCGCFELPDSALTPLQNYGSTLQALDLDRCFKITDNGLSFIATGCPSLTFISLYRCKVTDTGLETLAKGCFGLKVINIFYCSSVTDQGIKPIVENCSKLNAVLISYCQGIKGVGFRGCSQSLEYLQASACYNLEPDGILGIVSGGGLKYLDLGWSILGDGLSAIGAGFGTQLRVLSTCQCSELRDETVEAIAKGCPSLLEWSLASCHEITVEGWKSIALNCRNLEILHVNRCGNLCDRGLHALENGCKKLSKLYMSDCPKISASSVKLFKLARGDVVVTDVETVVLPHDFRAIMYPSFRSS